MTKIPPEHVSELEDSFKVLSPTVFAYAYKRAGGDVGLAEDLVQQAFVEAAVHWDLLRARSHEDRAAWLRLVVKDDAIDVIRRQRTARDKQGALWLATRTAQVDPFDAANLLLLVDRCNASIDQMPPRRREVVRLKWGAHRNNQEIARALGITEKAVSAHVAAARAVLRRIIKAHTVETEPARKEGQPDGR